VVAANLTKRQLDYEWVIVSAIADEATQNPEPGKKKSQKKKKEVPEKKKAKSKAKSEKF